MAFEEGSAGSTPTLDVSGEDGWIWGNFMRAMRGFLLSDLEITHLVRDMTKTPSFHYLFNLVKNEDIVVYNGLGYDRAVHQLFVFLGLLSKVGELTRG